MAVNLVQWENSDALPELAFVDQVLAHVLIRNDDVVEPPSSGDFESSRLGVILRV